MENDEEAARRLRKAMHYKRYVATGKQKVYNSNNSARRRDRRREEKVSRAREFLLTSNQMHLEGAVTAIIRKLPKGSVIKDPVIRSCIRKCERDYELKKLLAAARSSDATPVATASIMATGNKDASGEDTLAVSTGGRTSAQPHGAEVCTSAQPHGAEVSTMAKKDATNQSDDAEAPALITPHKPEEDVSGLENEMQVDDGSNGVEDDDDCMHCHDDDSIVGNSISGSNDVGLGSTSNTKPAAFVAPKEEGRPCFVLIRNNFSTEQHPSSNLYWPALLYSSKDTLYSNFPFRNNQDRLSVQVECWKNEHACGIGTGNYSAGEVKVAILLGNDVPPCRTRSVPVPVSRAFGTMPYHCVYTKKKANGLRKWKGYADNNKFLEALDMLERYVVSKDSTNLSSMKYT